MKILFYLSKAYSFPVVAPLVQYFDQQAPEVSYRFYLSLHVKVNFPTHWNSAGCFSTFAEACAFQPDFVLCPGNYVDYRLPGYKVQLFHGLGVEKPAHFKIRDLFDVYLTSGPYVTQRYQALALQHKNFIVKETGWLKADHILNFQAPEKYRDWPEAKYQKVILYAPTFSRTMQSATDLLPVLPNVLKKEELLLIKFHELMPDTFRQSLESLKGSQIVFLPTGDITPYLYLSDVLISDTSSVIYEFLILGKPVITYNTLECEDKGLNIKKPEQLRQALDCLLYRESPAEEYPSEALKRVNPYLEGQVSENVYRALKEIKEQGILTPSKKPWNLFRKAKILMNHYFAGGNFQ
jgi:CDP-ribitol ribitolphosphotransferase / teichoic acid ribitol-phosphate polymerase